VVSGTEFQGFAANVARVYLTELARNPAFLTKLYPFLQSPDSGFRKGLLRGADVQRRSRQPATTGSMAHDPDGDVASAALKAKRAIRARMDSPAPAGKS